MTKEQNVIKAKKSTEAKEYSKWLLEYNETMTYEEWLEYRKMYKVQEARWISEIFGDMTPVD
jgi:hypothetical protein